MAGESLPQATLPALAPPPPERLPAVPERITGARKAAVLMAALGSERAANVLARMGEEEIESLSVEMARLSSVGAQATESIFSELAAGAGEASGGVSGGLDYAREVIERALGPERAADLLGRLSTGAPSRPFEFLRRVPADRIAALLRGESAQTVALVLASLPASLAADVLSHLPEREQPGIALRIARMGEASTRVIQQVEEVIRHKLGSAGEQVYSSTGGAKSLAGILNHADRATERNVLENLAGADQDLAARSGGCCSSSRTSPSSNRAPCSRFSARSTRRTWCSRCVGRRGRHAGGHGEHVRARRRDAKEEMEIQQPQRKRDVDDAQSRVVSVVRKLEEAGTIVIGSDGAARTGRRRTCLRRPSLRVPGARAVRSSAPRRCTATPRAGSRGGRGDTGAGSCQRSGRRPRGGVARSSNEMRSAVTALDDAARGLHALRGEVADAVERDAVEFALALAGKILAGTLRSRPRRSRRHPRGAAARQRPAAGHGAREPAGPAHHHGLRRSGATQSKGFGLQDLQADQRVAPGGAIVRTQEGEIDAGIATQLERAREVIASELEGEESPRERAARRPAGEGVAGCAGGGPRAPPRIREQPHRPDHRGHRPAGRGRRGVPRRNGPQPRPRFSGGRRVQGWPHTPDAPRRAARDRAGHQGARDRCAVQDHRRRRPARPDPQRSRHPGGWRPGAAGSRTLHNRSAPRGAVKAADHRACGARRARARRAGAVWTGQRLGIFAGSGVGKSSLLGMIARSTSAT